MPDFLFSYDDICLRPKHSILNSRSDADTTTNLCGYKFKLPIVPANMVDVISFENANYLSDNDYFYIMHRFDGATKKFADYAFTNKLKLISISCGINEESKEDIIYAREKIGKIDFLTIDVAHADNDKVGRMMDWIHDYFDGYDKPKLIIGNVATEEGYKYLVGLGADVIKCGIGGGSICSTRYKTGFHLPTASSIIECVSAGLSVPIIADGGATHFGDIAKALVLGADMIMSGRWFAECIDSSAKIHDGKKIYRGSTSFESKGHNNHVEGLTLKITEGCTYAERLIEIQQALRSSISYGGGKDLSAFNNVEWELLK
jgi:GMP reductase